jgi:hypothetical protein
MWAGQRGRAWMAAKISLLQQNNIRIKPDNRVNGPAWAAAKIAAKTRADIPTCHPHVDHYQPILWRFRFTFHMDH